MVLSKRKNNNPDLFDPRSLKRLLTAETPFAIKEAYSAIRTNLMFTSRGETCPVYAVTSSGPSEGKTTNCVNLAVSFAQMEKRVLLIDADLRKPTVNKYFGVSCGDGLSEFLAGMQNEVNLRHTNIKNLAILTGGKCPPNPAELLSCSKMKELLDFFKQHFDCIFIDTPPVELVTDASVISEVVTGYIFVVKNGSSDRGTLKHSISILEYVNAKVIGFLLNDVNQKDGRYFKKYNNKYKYYKRDYVYSGSNNTK